MNVLWLIIIALLRVDNSFIFGRLNSRSYNASAHMFILAGSNFTLALGSYHIIF